MATRYVLPLESLRMTDVARVGGKNRGAYNNDIDKESSAATP